MRAKNTLQKVKIKRVLMNQPSGFVPIQFHMAGRILLVIGIIGIVLFTVARLTGWFALPPAILGVSIVVILVSLYLIFVVPREE
jgi:hypothetical protein